MRLVWGTVVGTPSDSSALQKLDVELDDGSSGVALSYPALVGTVAPGDRVLINTTAVDLGLGTGGAHFVVATAGGGGQLARGVVLDQPSGGHVMKLRYTPLQRDVVAVESPESPHHEAMRTATRLEGLPVVCCSLHSQVPLVAAAVKSARPQASVVYCMTDEAALPAPLSGLLAAMVDTGLIDASITCGQSFGGTLEAVNLHSGLLAARAVCSANVAIVAIGPGVVGTATPLGHGGVAQGEAINAAASLGGRPIAALRLSFADSRERHRGLSHHTVSALATVALARSVVAVPALGTEQAAEVDRALDEAGIWEHHDRVDSPGVTPDLRGLAVKTMGRGPADDPAFFSAAFAAGEVAAALY